MRRLGLCVPFVVLALIGCGSSDGGATGGAAGASGKGGAAGAKGGASGTGGSAGVSGSGGAGGGSGGASAGTGLCESTCAKTCASDLDCETSQGELCCDYGQAGKSCSQAAACPIMCTDDSRCDTTKGQACERVDLSLADKYCTAPSNGLQLCALDSDCTTPGTFAAAIYDQPFCLPASDCPKPCGASTDCNTANGEICCTSIPVIEPHINATGLCLNPAYAACPKLCTQSTDCNTAANEICCNGDLFHHLREDLQDQLGLQPADLLQVGAGEPAATHKDLLHRPPLRGDPELQHLRHLRSVLRLQRIGDGILPGLHAADVFTAGSAMARALSPAPLAGPSTDATRPTARAAPPGPRPEPVSRKLGHQLCRLLFVLGQLQLDLLPGLHDRDVDVGPALGTRRTPVPSSATRLLRDVLPGGDGMHLERHDQHLYRDDRAMRLDHEQHVVWLSVRLLAGRDVELHRNAHAMLVPYQLDDVRR